MENRNTPTGAGADRKLAEAILHVANRCKDTADFGTTKLYKILFFADAESYKARKATITGDSYVKRKYGPTPKHGMTQLAELEATGGLTIDTRDKGIYKVLGPNPLREADLSVFDKDEVAFLDAAIDKYSRMTAKKLSTMTHEMPAWRWAELNGDMSLELLFSAVRCDLSPMTNEEKSEAVKAYRETRAA